jgi:hypothetical protein
MGDEMPRININRITANRHPTLKRIRQWYGRINSRLGKPLPTLAFIGWLPRHMEKKYCGFSCWLQFSETERGVVILIHRNTAFNPNFWMGTLTHEIAHLLNPNEDCGTEKHEDEVIALRRKVLNIKRWRLL